VNRGLRIKDTVLACHDGLRRNPRTCCYPQHQHKMAGHLSYCGYLLLCVYVSGSIGSPVSNEELQMLIDKVNRGEMNPAMLPIHGHYNSLGTKRAFEFGLGKKDAQLDDLKRAYEFGLGRRAYDFGIGKRQRSNNPSLGMGRRSFDFGIGKRSDQDKQEFKKAFEFGVGRRAAYDQELAKKAFEFGLGKKAFEFGLGKKAFEFGLGKKAFEFGLGKKASDEEVHRDSQHYNKLVAKRDTSSHQQEDAVDASKVEEVHRSTGAAAEGV